MDTLMQAWDKTEEKGVELGWRSWFSAEIIDRVTSRSMDSHKAMVSWSAKLDDLSSSMRENTLC